MLQALLPAILPIIGKFIPDKDQAERLAHDIATMAADHAHKEVMAQLEINREQAKHPSIFVAGARPATLWIGNIGLLYAVFIYPVLNIWVDMPELDTAILMAILTGLLGFGGMRSYEKKAGVSRDNMN